MSIKQSDRKKEIIEVAKKLFFTQGYEKTTIEAIISDMGVSKGMFYHHYKSKDEVLEDVLNDVAAIITKEVVDILTNKNRNAKGKIDDLFTYKRRNLKQMDIGRYKLTKSFWMEFFGRVSGKCIEIINPYFNQLIYDGIEEGCFKVKNAKYTALIFTSLFVSVGSMEKEYLKLYDNAEEILEASMDVVGRILGCDFNE